MHYPRNKMGLAARVLFGFLAGFIATLGFHQVVVAILHDAGIAPMPAFQMNPTAPFGVPMMLSLAFWGGIWGVVFSLMESGFPRGIGYWLMALLFGALLPTAVALFVVLPLKGHALSGMPHWPLLITALSANGAWGFGTALMLRLAQHRVLRRTDTWT